MSKPKSKSRGVLFWKNMGLVLLMTCIPIACISVIMYYIGTDRIGTEVNKAHQQQLGQSIQQIDDYLTNLERFVVRVAFDPRMDETLNELNNVQEFQKTNELMKSFSLMKESNYLIDSVGLYLRDAEMLIGDEAGVRSIRTEEDRSLFHSLLVNERLIYWNYALKKINKPDTVNKAIVIKLPGGQLDNSFGVFLIYLDQAKLNGMVQKLASGDGVAFLINEKGDYLTPPLHRESIQANRALEEVLRSRIMNENVSENTFKFDWNDQSYSVSYGKINKFGGSWTVISATPISQIIAPVTSLSSLILWISIFGLALGLLLSWFASNKIYDPIVRLRGLFESSRLNKSDEKNEIAYIENQWKQHLQEQQALSIRIRQATPTLRESLLLQLLQGNLYTHTEPEIIDRLKQLDWDIDNKRFAVVVAQLHGMSDLGENYSHRDTQLITFAASNIMLELCVERIPMVQVINFQDLSVGAFLVVDPQKSKEEMKSLLDQLARDYTATLNNVLRMNVTIVISKIAPSILDMRNILDQTRKTLRFRDVHASNQVLDMSELLLGNTRRAHYPSELEREIVHTIAMGLEDEAVRLIRQFMTALQGNNSTELMVHQGMMKLLGTIHDMINKYDVDIYSLYEGVHLYEQLMQIREPEETVRWFGHQVIRPFIKTLSMAYDPYLKGAIEKLVERLHEEFMDDISLETYADRLSMSPSKLSRAFKQITGMNFIDYIIRLRIEKCKELLVSTNIKINEIAELLHVQPSYLIRIFKKSEGLTPGQYRDKHTLL